MPSTRKLFWKTKLNGNKERDKKVWLALHKEGWKVLAVWECQTKNIEKLNQRLRKFLIS
jgi:DNA mismatch endonuclease, patch repair protein